MTPRVRAWAATLLFSGIALIPLWQGALLSSYASPHLLFYSVLTLNTFYSIRLYARIQPRNLSQTVIDTILGMLYMGLALSIGKPVPFAALALLVFVAATPKYIFMLGKIPYDALLRRKIKIDTTGVALCGVVFVGTVLGFGAISAWLLAIVFALANIYLLLIRPMYLL